MSANLLLFFFAVELHFVVTDVIASDILSIEAFCFRTGSLLLLIHPNRYVSFFIHCEFTQSPST